jgi:hypothetical protein
LIARRRQLAVWSLATAADNVKRYDRLPPETRTAILARLEEEAASEVPARRQPAKMAHDFLAARAAGTPTALDVDKTLARCATADNLDLRNFTALALTFWRGTPEENARMEQTLLQLSDASALPPNAEKAYRLRNTEPATDAEVQRAIVVKAREVRYQASMALARRGSTKTAERFAVFHEMLDEESLGKIFQVKDRGTPDTAIIGVVMTDAMKSLVALHRQLAENHTELDLSPLVPDVQKVAQHENGALRLTAEKTLAELQR